MTAFLPEPVPLTAGPPELQEYLFRELSRIGNALETADQVSLPNITMAPTRPSEGDIVYADGTLFDPGDGEGFYGYVNGNWEKLNVPAPTADDLGLGTGDDVTFARLRLTAGDDASLSSTLHAFQIGATGGTNVIIDPNEIMARNNGVASPLFLNAEGGLVSIGEGGLSIAGGNAVNVQPLEISATDDGASFGPDLSLFRDSVSPGIIDTLGVLSFNGRSSTGVKRRYAGIFGGIITATNGAEDGRIFLQTMVGGAPSNTVTIDGAVVSLNQGQLKFLAVQNPSADANTLDDYEENTWTPQLKFGGASVGIVGSQSGTYTKIGRLVFFSCAITLSNKGSSTGAASIDGLPFPVTTPSATASISLGFWSGMSGITGNITGRCGTPNVNSFELRHATSTAATGSLTEANFTNTSILRLSGVYEAA